MIWPLLWLTLWSSLPLLAQEDDDFVGSFTIEVREFKKGKERKDSPYRTRYHLDEGRFAVEPDLDEDKDNITMVYDQADKKIITKTVSDGERSATITPMIKLSLGMNRQSDEDEGVTVEATGRSKTIQGYTCQAYRIITEDGVTLAWIAPDLHINLGSATDMVKIKGVEGAQTSASRYDLQGTVLEAHTEEKGGKITRDYYLQDIVVGEVPEAVFSLEGFEVIDVMNPFGN